MLEKHHHCFGSLYFPNKLLIFCSKCKAILVSRELLNLNCFHTSSFTLPLEAKFQNQVSCPLGRSRWGNFLGNGDVESIEQMWHWDNPSDSEWLCCCSLILILEVLGWVFTCNFSWWCKIRLLTISMENSDALWQLWAGSRVSSPGWWSRRSAGEDGVQP